MDQRTAGIVYRAEGRPRDGFEDLSHGDVTWCTLISSDITPSSGLSAGLAELAPHGGLLALHRHAQPEIYYVTEGTGVLTINGVETVVTAGAAVFIPGDAEHGIRNEADTMLRLFYVFPADRFGDVVYRF